MTESVSVSIPQWDVLVVGCGAAGLSAAVAAQQGGARVLVLERAPADERGGNTRHTGSWLRMKSVDEVSDDFIDHFAANAGGFLDPSMVHMASTSRESWPPTLRTLSFADPEVVATFAEEAPPTLRWLQGFGVRFEKLEVPFLTSVQPRMAPHGGGFALAQMASSAHLDATPLDHADHSDEERALFEEHIVAYRLDGPLFFGVAHQWLLELSELSEVRVVILRMSRIATLDATGASVLADTVRRLRGRGIAVLLSGIRPDHEPVFLRQGVHDAVGDGHVFATTPEAIAHALTHLPPGKPPTVLEFREIARKDRADPVRRGLAYALDPARYGE